MTSVNDLKRFADSMQQHNFYILCDLITFSSSFWANQKAVTYGLCTRRKHKRKVLSVSASLSYKTLNTQWIIIQTIKMVTSFSLSWSRLKSSSFLQTTQPAVVAPGSCIFSTYSSHATQITKTGVLSSGWY